MNYVQFATTESTHTQPLGGWGEPGYEARNLRTSIPPFDGNHY